MVRKAKKCKWVYRYPDEARQVMHLKRRQQRKQIIRETLQEWHKVVLKNS